MRPFSSTYVQLFQDKRSTLCTIVHYGAKPVLKALERNEYDIDQFAGALEEMERGSEGVFEYLHRILSDKA